MKICHISDTHGMYFKDLAPGDVLIHSGDGLLYGDLAEVRKFSEWFKSQEYKHKVFVPGNHDRCFETNYHICEQIMSDAGVNTLVNCELDINFNGRKVKVWGSPYTKSFGGWSFMKREEILYGIFSHIPESLDILVTHGPPQGILDEVKISYIEEYFPGNIRQNFIKEEMIEHTGSTSLMGAIKNLKQKPKLHLFGHIHEAYGFHEEDEIRFFNSSVVNERLEAVGEPNYIKYEV